MLDSGAIVNPQFPAIAVVTPWSGDGLKVRVPERLRVEVRMDVHESGSNDAAVGVDDAGRIGVDRAELDDPIAGDPDIATGGWGAGAVDHEPAADHQVECRCHHMAE